MTGLEVIAVLGDDNQALIMYEVSTGPFGRLTCGERLTVRDGKIQTDRVAFDTFAIRMGRQAAGTTAPGNGTGQEVRGEALTAGDTALDPPPGSSTLADDTR
ncbi:MAG: hypothetical protein ACRDPA_24085 [Solirubrobacteraceae bacterium]